MIKSTIEKWLGGSSPAVCAGNTYDADALETCIEQFRIGSRIGYYPEARSEMKVDSLVLGYAIDDFMVFARDSVTLKDGALHLTEPETVTIPLEEVERFRLILPKLDRREVDWTPGTPDRNASARRINDFARNAIITIFKNSMDGGVPTLDTIVRRSMLLREGPYANQGVSLLEPKPESFTFIDRRQHCRISCRIPIQIRCSKEQPLMNAIIHDFSERHLRIGSVADIKCTERLHVGKHLVIIIDLEEQDQRFIMNGTITRKVKNDVVVLLKGILDNNYFREITLITELAIKSALINHPSSRK